MKPIDFLQNFHGPTRAWILTAIPASQKGIDTRAFPPGPSQADDAAAFIALHNGKDNLYFSVASVIDPEDKKASLANVAAVHWLHVDIDAEPGQDLADELKRIRKLVTKGLPVGAPKPTAVIYSGGGYQIFFKLAQPIPVQGDLAVAKEAGLYNKQLELIFGGDSCHNVDRIMRLPGTQNLPSARKVAKGRVQVEAKLITAATDWDRVYNLTDFDQAADTDSGEIEISGNVARLASVDDLDQWNVPDRVKVIVVQGIDPDDRDKHPSRSEWLFDCVFNLVRADVPDETVFAVITDPGFKISESVTEQNNPRTYAIKQLKSAHEAVLSPRLHAMNQQYAVIKNWGGRCVVIEEVYDEALDRTQLVRQAFTDFRNAYMNQFETGENAKGDPTRIAVGKWWLEHAQRRQFNRLVFQPGRTPEGAYNLWQGFGCNAIPGTGHESYLQHLFDTVCPGSGKWAQQDDEAQRMAANVLYKYLVQWMAAAVQRPAEPGGTAVVMRGKQGIGKGFAAVHFLKLFGRHGLHISNANHLTGNFNGHLRDVIALFADEAVLAADAKAASILKALVTETTIMIESKGIDAEACPNYVHLIMASNSDWVVPVGPGDRRYFILDVDEAFARNEDHFGSIAADLKAGGYGNLLHFLQHVDLGGYSSQQIPETAAKTDHRVEDMKRNNPIEHAVFELLHTGQVSWDSVEAGGEIFFQVAALHAYLKATYDKMKRATLTPIGLGKTLAVYGFTGGHQKRIGGTQYRCQKLPTLQAGRARFEEKTGQAWAWDEDVTEIEAPEEGEV